MSTMPTCLSSCLVVAAAGAAFAADLPLPATVEFNRDIRPILSNICFTCHGPDQNARKADLRLDTQEGALEDRGTHKIIVPGKPTESELFRRISATSEKRRMPPANHTRQLTPRQIALIGKWIEQGATWQKHWSLITPVRPAVPQSADKFQPRSPIDRFLLQRLDEDGLKLSPEADRRTLIRRLSFDLTGLPPTPAEVDAFLADNSADAYEKLVDRLLASPAYGERMALYWLDLVRYADSAGYHSDNHRDIWPYRDYVIKAFNENKRFDAFTREQLAGDLLVDASLQTRIASGYNRLLMTTEEGGAQAKEYTAKYQADRVRNVTVVWLGATMGCAECHDHKFDPFTTKDFYSLAAFFADVGERAVGRQDQTRLPAPDQAAAIAKLDAAAAPLQKRLDTQTPELDAGLAKWEAGKPKAPVGKAVPKDLPQILALEPAKRTPAQKQTLAAFYRTIAPELEPVRKEMAELKRKKDEIEKSVPQTLTTMRAANPRVVRVLPRGNWLDDSGEVVQPATPGALPAGKFDKKRADRLDLAEWMLAPQNPLTSRVMVNRLWKLMFGQGIVNTLDDFGSQGTWPTHPALLDWLAVEFREKGWDVKATLKLLAMSAAYRQTSAVSETLARVDPYNRLFARQDRFRLEAEMVRDNALAISGLLVNKIGGPSVKPYQPAGYWSYLNFPKREWANDRGEGLYRRGLYTYWQRTFLHPSLAAFDAPSREECTVERPRSNTPLQALALLNDPTYVEAARMFAERIIKEGGADAEGRIHFAFRRALGRKAGAEELKIVVGLLEKQRARYAADKAAATALLAVGDHAADKTIDPVESAAWTAVARTVLNLHETMTRN
jgi:hypothetical protein